MAHLVACVQLKQQKLSYKVNANKTTKRVRYDG